MAFEIISCYKAEDGTLFESLDEVKAYEARSQLYEILNCDDPLRSWEGSMVEADVFLNWISKHRKLISSYLRSTED